MWFVCVCVCVATQNKAAPQKNQKHPTVPQRAQAS